MGALAALRVRAGGVPRDSGRRCAVEDRGGGVPVRPGRPVAGRPDRPPRARRHRPRRDVVVDLAGGGPRPAGDVGPVAVRAGGLPPRTVLRQRDPRAAGGPARGRVVDEHLRDRPAAGPGGPDPDERRGLAAPALRRLRRGPAHPAARRRRRLGGAGRRGGRPAHPAEPRGRLPQQPAGRRAGRRPRDDRLQLLGPRTGRLRPQSAPGRRRPDRQARRRRPGRGRRGDRGGVRRGAAGRGLRDPGGAGPAQPRAVPADDDRAVDRAVRPVRRSGRRPHDADRRGPRGTGPLCPRSRSRAKRASLVRQPRGSPTVGG